MLLENLLELNILGLHAATGEADQTETGVNTEPGELGVRPAEIEVEAEASVGLAPFEPFSLWTPGSKGEMQLKIRLPRLRMDTE